MFINLKAGKHSLSKSKDPRLTPCRFLVGLRISGDHWHVAGTTNKSVTLWNNRQCFYYNLFIHSNLNLALRFLPHHMHNLILSHSSSAFCFRIVYLCLCQWNHAIDIFGTACHGNYLERALRGHQRNVVHNEVHHLSAKDRVSQSFRWFPCYRNPVTEKRT